MSNEYKKLSEEELLQSSGGVDKLASLGGGPVWKVKGLSAGTISLKSDPSQNSSEIAHLKNGDVVQATGGKIRISDDVSGKKAITYTQVYVPSLKQSGWIASDYLGSRNLQQPFIQAKNNLSAGTSQIPRAGCFYFILQGL